MQKVYRGGIIFFFVFTGAQIEAQNILHNAPLYVKPGQPLPIEARFSYNQDIMQAFLYARVGNGSVYMPILMSRSGSQMRAEIPAYLVTANGVEYYIEVRDKAGVVHTLPNTNPERFPFSIKASQESAFTDAVLANPMPDSKIDKKKPPIEIQLLGDIDASFKYTVKVNDRNITSSARIVNKKITVDLPFSLENGGQSVALEYSTTLGGSKTKTWQFFVVPEGMVDTDRPELEWKSTGTISESSQFSKTVSEKETKLAYPNGFHTVNAFFKAEAKDYYFSLGPFMVTSQQIEDRQPINQFTFAAGSPMADTKWGNVGTQFTPLVGGSSFWGGEVQLHSDKSLPGQKWAATVAAGQTKKAVEAENDPGKVGTFSQRMYGGKFEGNPFHKNVTLGVSYANVKDDKQSIRNAGTQVAVEGHTTGILLGLKFESFLQSIDIEYAYADSKYEAKDITQQFTGSSWKGSLGFEFKPLFDSLKLGYTEMQENFLNLITGAQGSSRAYTLATASTIGKLTINGSGNYSHDNVSGKNKLTNTNRGAGLQLGYTISSLTLGLSDQFQQQISRGDPSLESTTNSNTVTSTTGYSFKLFEKSISNSLNLSQTDTASIVQGPGSRSRIRNGALTITIGLFSFLNFSGSGGKTENFDLLKDIKSYTDTFSTTLSWQLFQGKLQFPMTASYAHSYDLAKTSNNQNTTYSVGITGTPAQGHTLSLSGSLNQYMDLIDARANYLQYSLNFQYNAQL